MSETIQLAYQSPPRGRWRRRLSRGAIVGAMIGITLWLADGDWYVRARMQVALLRAQRACMNFEAPPDCVAVEAGDKAGRALLKQHGGQAYRAWNDSGFDLAFTPPDPPTVVWMGMNRQLQAMCNATVPVERFNEIYDSSNRIADPAFSQAAADVFTIVFLHAMRSSAGDRLVDAEVVCYSNAWYLRCFVWKPATWDAAPVCLNPLRDQAAVVSDIRTADGWLMPPSHHSNPGISELLTVGRIDRFYVGQMNPSDRSRFSIRYHSPAGMAYIDGHLLPDNTVELTQEAAKP